MLVLPIKKQWYDMILSGEKKEEYRTISPYYYKRFENIFGSSMMESLFSVSLFSKFITNSAQVLIRNGYRKSSPSAVIQFHLSTGTGKQEWGAEKGQKYFVLSIEKVFTVDTSLKPGVWKKDNSSGYFTPGGDPVYKCPFCGSSHVYGIEVNIHHIVCDKCCRLMKYPWELK